MMTRRKQLLDLRAAPGEPRRADVAVTVVTAMFLLVVLALAAIL